MSGGSGVGAGTGGRTGSDALRFDVTTGKAAGFGFVVDQRLVIGRNAEGPGRLADDPELSRDHAEICRSASGAFTISDLASTNGTFVNGARINTATVLCVGDEIEVGATKLVVRSAPVVKSKGEVDARAKTAVAEIGAMTRGSFDHGVSGRGSPVVAQERFVVRLAIDFADEAAELVVRGDGQPIYVVLDHGEWRVDTGRS